MDLPGSARNGDAGKTRRCPILVLSRRKGEIIRIGHDIVIAVVAIVGDKVRIGIDAPDEIAIHREEVYAAIQRTEGRDGQGDEGDA